MYLNFFGFSSAPFSIAPDPNFLYLTEKHQEALAHLLYSTTQKGGFIMLTGEIGTGKTTLCRHFLRIVPDQYQTAFIFNPKISSEELLATICDEFGIVRPEGPTSIKQLTDLINFRLLDIHAAGKNALLIIDEAQNLSMDVLEQVRLLTNLETTEHKLLQIILIGQPQLKTLLRREELRQLSQRIVARYHLEPLSWKETVCYIKHRLITSGSSDEDANVLFSLMALWEIYRRTEGVPRMVNVLCDRALLGAYVENRHVVSRRIVRNAEREAFGDDDRTSLRTQVSRPGVVVLGACLLLLAGGLLFDDWSGTLSFARNTPLAEKPAVAASAVASTPVSASVPAAVAASTSAASLRFPAGSESAAHRSLFGLWGVSVGDTDVAAGKACPAAVRYGLRCFEGVNRNWHQFRQFNLPAVLTLRDVDQREFHALIESATDEQATLRIDDQVVKLDLRQLAFYWTGRFTLLWRPPPGYVSDEQLTQKSLSALAKTPPRWLYDQLGADADAMRLPIRDLIAQFQRQAGLYDDGILGVQTLLMLSRSAGQGPSL